MRKLIRVTISACLALTMVLSLLPMSVIAAERDELQAKLFENQQVLSLPFVSEGDDAPTANTEDDTYSYVGVDSVHISKEAIITSIFFSPGLCCPAWTQASTRSGSIRTVRF